MMFRWICLLGLLAAIGGAVALFAAEWARMPRPLAAGEPEGGEPPDPTGPDPAEEAEERERVRTPFAADREGPASPDPVELDGRRAMESLRAVCALGPRMSGTAAMRKQQELLRKHFTKLGARVRLQEFEAKQVSRRDPVGMTNLIASWNPDRNRRV